MPTTIHASAAEIRQGRLSPLALVESCLTEIDRQETRVRAWVLVDREGARTAARRAEEEIRRGQLRGPLHGIPVGIKDIIDVFDWPTAAGSRLWEQSIARQDATCVRKLRQAGAIILGKTVTTQFASFDPPVTRNPWNLQRTPGGSSSGSAAAVACSMCLGALGSQTGGSLNRPASFCGVATLKPTFGRVSAAGVVPLAASMDHVGPMAWDARDLAILLQAIAGPDPTDPNCADQLVQDYVAALDRPLAAPRFGRLRGQFDDHADPVMLDLVQQAVQVFVSWGASCRDAALPASFAEVIARHRTVMAVEAAQFHQVRLERHPEGYAPRIRELLLEGLTCSATEYARAKEHQRLLKREMMGCFEGVDVLLAPATRGPAPDAATTGDPLFNSPWSFTGLPSLSFPAGRSPEGMPLCLQLVGRPWGEAELLAAGAWCEDVLGMESTSPAPSIA
jgi:aspartyl-tRNA(Asn)/glutamyl-tRNA(Gln) amidotransferase subunit A